MPERIQRRRTKGWRLPPNTVYVGRPTKWGNPIRITVERTQRGGRVYRVHGSPTDVNGGPCYVFAETAHNFAVRFFRWDMANHRFGTAYPSVNEIRRELAGRDLACWCPLEDERGNPVPCHADVLLEIANSEEPDRAS